MSAQRQFNIDAIGFSEKELALLKSILSLTKSRDRSYAIAINGTKGKADIVLIDEKSSEEYNLTTKKAKNDNNFAPELIVGNRNSVSPNDSKYSIFRPIMPTKLLNILDSITIEEIGYSPETFEDTVNNNLGNSNKSSFKPKSSLKVLVVDDSKPVQQALGVQLGKFGILPVYASSGEEALEKIKDTIFHLIFLDVTLPGIDGYTVCKTIKSGKTTKGTPVCMLTGKSTRLNKIKGKMSGCENYLTKPVDVSELNNVIYMHLPGLLSKER